MTPQELKKSKKIGPVKSRKNRASKEESCQLGIEHSGHS